MPKHYETQKTGGMYNKVPTGFYGSPEKIRRNTPSKPLNKPKSQKAKL